MNRFTKNNKNWGIWCALAFFVPLLILLIVMCIQNIWPMGENSMLIWDMEIQYINYYNWFHDVLHGNASILYDFSKSLGGNMYGIFAVRFTSPINLLLYFFPKENVTDFITFSTLLKICLSGLFCEVFLLKRFKKTNRWITVLFSTSYALMEYSVGLCSNLHFMDLIYMLPLVALGVYYFVSENCRTFLCVTVGLSVLFNWYIAYSVCAFAVFYYFYEYFLAKNGDRIKTVITKFLRFMGWVITGVMIGGVSIVPSVIASSNGKGQLDLDYFFTSGFHSNFFTALKSLLLSTRANTTDENPAIYIGGLVIAVVLFGFFDKRIKCRTKIASFLFIVFIFTSFSYTPLEMIWGAFKQTFSFYFRYSFVLSFLLVVVAGHFLEELSVTEERYRSCAFIAPTVLLAAAGIVLYVTDQEGSSWDGVYLAVICVLAVLCQVFYQYRGKWMSTAAVAMVSILLFLDLGTNAVNEFSRYSITREEYSEYIAEVDDVIEEIADSDDSFYRLETTISEMDVRRATQTPAATESLNLNYNGITHYSSLYDSTVNDFLIYTGYSRKNAKSVNYVDSNPVMDSILGVKYLLSTREEYAELEQIGKFTYHDGTQAYIYENAYALSFATKISDASIEEYVVNPFKNQNAILDAMLGYESGVFTELEYESDETGTWEIKVSQDGPVYIYMGPIGSKHLSVNLLVNGEAVEGKYFSRFYHYIVYAGEYNAGDVIEITLEDDEDCEVAHYLYAYVLNMDNYEAAFATLQEDSISPEVMDDDYVKLTWYAEDEEEQILLSVPYDDGWDIYVNGEKVCYSKAYDALITLTVEQGENVIEMKYFPPYLHHGMLVTAIGILILVCPSVIMALLKRRRIKKNGNQKDASVASEDSESLNLIDIM